MVCAIQIALVTSSSVAASDPATTQQAGDFDLMWWVTTASLVLAPLILVGLVFQGAWKLPPSPRLPAWRIPLEVGFLAFATSMLLGGIGQWFGGSMAGGEGQDASALQASGMATIGAYLGAGIPLLAMGVIWTQLPRPVGSERPLPHFASIIFGAIALCIGLPLVETAAYLGNALQQAFQESEPVTIAHETLRQLTDSSGDIWWWVVAIGALVAAPVVEETLYRGILQQSLRRLGVGRWWAILATSGIFTLLHIPLLSTEAMLGSLAALLSAGILFGWIREQTGRLDAPIVAHILFNAFNLVLALLIAG